MAIAASAFTSGISAGSGTAFATASKVFASNNLYYHSICTYRAAGAIAPTSVKRGTTAFTYVTGDAGSSAHRADVYCFLGDGSTGTVVIDYNGVTQDRCQWGVDELTGTDISGTNGNGSIVQSSHANGGTTTITTTLGAFADAVNNAAWCCGENADGGDPPIKEAGYTDLAGNTSFLGIKNEYKIGQDTSPSFTQSGGNNWACVAIEVKAASGGGATSWGPDLSDQLNRIVVGGNN